MSRPPFLTSPFARTGVPADSDPHHELFPASVSKLQTAPAATVRLG